MGKVNIILIIVGVTLIGLVLGLSYYNEQAEAGFTVPIGDPCDSFGGVIQHWDKIIFKPNQRLFNDSPSPSSPFVLSPNKIYDIKVVQDPLAVTDLQGTVSKFLRDSGYRTSVGEVFPRFIEIVDVEYEKACTSIVLTVVDFDGDGYTTDGTGLGLDCDDDNALVNPGAIEIFNGIDDNCDGVIDEGFDLVADGGAMSSYLPLSINSLGFE